MDICETKPEDPKRANEANKPIAQPAGSPSDPAKRVLEANKTLASANVLMVAIDHVYTLDEVTCVLFDKTGVLCQGEDRLGAALRDLNMTADQKARFKELKLGSRSSAPPVAELKGVFPDVEGVEALHSAIEHGFFVRTEIAPEAPAMIAELRALPHPPLIAIVSGDGKAQIETVANGLQLGAAVRDPHDAPWAEGETPVVVAADGSALHFARTMPTRKADIVRAHQAAGHVVLFVGDGMNDVPAMQAADVSIAMGFCGCREAKAVADAIVLDDSLSGVAVALKVGVPLNGRDGARRVWNRIQGLSMAS